MDMTKKLTKDLIEMYWERKCLWQVNSIDYKRRDMKKKAYQEIVTFLRKNGVKDANAKLVREKIQNLRRAMRKEKKRIDSSGGAYSPTLWYYDLLIFVNDQYEDTSPATLSKMSEDNSNETDMCEAIFTDTDEELHNDDDEKLDPIETTNEKKEKKQRNLAKSDIQNNGNETEMKAVGINFTAKLKRMESKQQILAELLIQKVLARGLLGQLNETTDVVDKMK